MKQTIFLFVVLLAATACRRNVEDPAPVVDNEVITTVRLTLTNTANAADVRTATWRQLDVRGINPPDTSQALFTLPANSSYNVTVQILDESKTPAEDKSPEIDAESKEHLFAHQPSPVQTSAGVIVPGTPVNATGWLRLTVSNQNLDNGTPQRTYGRTARYTTTTASTGRLRIVLRHQPTGKDGTYAPGSTDADASFRVTIQ
jgi:hypothetical protein